MDSDNLSMYLEKEGWLKYTSTFLMILILTMKRIKKTGHLALFLVFVQSDEFI